MKGNHLTQIVGFGRCSCYVSVYTCCFFLEFQSLKCTVYSSIHGKMIQHLNVFSSYDCFNRLLFLCWIISFWIIPGNLTTNRSFFFARSLGETKTATNPSPCSSLRLLQVFGATLDEISSRCGRIVVYLEESSSRQLQGPLKKKKFFLHKESSGVFFCVSGDLMFF